MAEIAFLLNGTPVHLSEAPPTRTLLDWLREERRKVLGDWVAFCLDCGAARRWFEELEAELPAACPQCGGPMLHRCGACGSPFSSVFAVDCEACGAGRRDRWQRKARQGTGLCVVPAATPSARIGYLASRMSWELVLTVLLVGIGWFWWDSLNKRELAVRVARIVCQKADVQLLDETVAMRRLRIARDENQRVCLLREFGFEYSDTGDNRLPGYVYLMGDRVVDANLVIPYAKEA